MTSAGFPWRRWLIILAVPCAAANAQIATDGSLGNAPRNLAGPNYQIPEALGRLAGSNLFHSFRIFNIAAGESATFTTTNSAISSVFARVTGGATSTINGQLRLEAAATNPALYFINPAGVTFGAGARIDVPGTFHVTTADYVKFPDGRFHVDLAQASTFSTAPAEAFGFLGAQRAAITVHDTANLSADAGSIGLIAGDVVVNNGRLATRNGGDIRVVALGLPAQTREIGIGLLSPVQSPEGTLSITGGAELVTDTTTRQNGGSIVVRAGRLAMDDGTIASYSHGGGGYLEAGTGQWIEPYGGHAGSIDVGVTGEANIANFSRINSTTYSPGNAGPVKVDAAALTLSHSYIESNSEGGGGKFYEITQGTVPPHIPLFGGHAGRVDVHVTGDARLLDFSLIGSGTESPGNAGAVRIDAGNLLIDNNSLVHSGSYTAVRSWDPVRFVSVVRPADHAGDGGSIEVAVRGTASLRSGGGISTNTLSQGRAGTVSLVAGRLAMHDGVISSVSTGGGGWFANGDYVAPYGGDAGTVRVDVSDAMDMTFYSHISTSTGSPGKAGNVSVTARNLSMDWESAITSAAYYGSGGRPGSITIVAHERARLQYALLSTDNHAWLPDNASPGSAATPATLSLTAPEIFLTGAEISAAAAGNQPASAIGINAGSLLHLDHSVIATSANEGNGGPIAINGGASTWLRDSLITTSVSGTRGNGGDIRVTSDVLVLNSGFIQANTAAGSARGGNIVVDIGALIPSYQSLLTGGLAPLEFGTGLLGYNVIQAAAPSGLSGRVDVTSPVLDLSGSLAALPAATMDSARLGRNPCRIGGGNSLGIAGRGSLPPAYKLPLSMARIPPAGARNPPREARREPAHAAPLSTMSSTSECPRA